MCLLNASFGKQFHKATTQFFRPKINDDHGVRRSNMGQILAQWWRPVASKVALDMLHPAMRLASHRRIVIAIEMARKGGAFFLLSIFCHALPLLNDTWLIKNKAKIYCSLLCIELVCILWWPANSNECCFGYHSRWRAIHCCHRQRGSSNKIMHPLVY